MRSGADRDMEIVTETEAQDIMILQNVTTIDREMVAKFMMGGDSVSTFSTFEGSQSRINRFLHFANSKRKFVKVVND